MKDERAGINVKRPTTVAAQLGGTPHLSPLLRKARRCGLGSPDDLLRLAVKRGCTHYAPPGFDRTSVNDPGAENLSDAELAIALISGAQEYHPMRIRCAAQLLGKPGLDAQAASRLALMERCEAVLAHIAGAALTHDLPEHQSAWTRLLTPIKRRQALPPGRLPHPSRFCLQTGVTGPLRPAGPKSLWLTPAVVDER